MQYYDTSETAHSQSETQDFIILDDSTEYNQEHDDVTEYSQELLDDSVYNHEQTVLTEYSENVFESEAQCDVRAPSEFLKKLRRNVKNVVQATSIMPFRWLVSAYRCFYCYEVFHHQDELKAHQNLHDDSEIVDAMNKFWDSTVYIDVSVLNCKLCLKTFDSVNNLIDHLTRKHKIPYHKEVAGIEAFKLGAKVSCTICNKEFDDFVKLLTHKSSVHQRSEDKLCYVCGRTFKPHQMKMHLANEHRSKTVKCTNCNKEFSVTTIRTHMMRVHNKRFKCPMCADTFETIYKRTAHITTVHRMREPVKCPLCPNTYYFQSTMRRHVKQVHVKEKNVQCSLCDWKGFKEYNLKQHVLKKHTKCLDMFDYNKD